MRDEPSAPNRAEPGDGRRWTSTAYNTDGTVDTVTDPRALVTKYVYDALGRRTKEIKNFDANVNSGNPSGTDQNVTVAYGYANTLRTTLTAAMPSGGGGDQVTRYIYGTTAGTPAQMKISTGHLLRAVKYPDSTNTGTTQADIDANLGVSDVDVVSYAYNGQGNTVHQKDQAGTVLESDFDLAGRATQSRATATGTGIDTAILRRATTYDTLGRVSKVDQYNNATVGSGTAQDGVMYAYDDWGNVLTYAEDRDSAISGGGNQYTTSYTWAKVAAATGRYTLRKTGMTLPDARAITYQYRSAGGLHDDEASRTTLVVDGAVALAQYDYLGVGTVVRTNLNQISCMSRVFDGSTPPVYVDLDQFNRITTSRWTKDLSTDRDFYQVALSYDEDSNITSAVDGVHGAYHGITAGYDVLYSMDNVNRLTEAKEGTLASGSIPSPTRDEAWTLSHTGNWNVDALDLNGNGVLTDPGDLNDHRTHNAVNELTARDTDNNGSPNYSPAYDAAGNMTDDAKDYKYVYDAWNRLRLVKLTGSSLLWAEYRYNGLNHRIGIHENNDLSAVLDSGDKWYYDVFDVRWRQLARYRESDSSPKEDFVPHQAGASGRGSSYIDRVICRNKDTNTAWTSASDGTLEERNYLCQNWRADVSAIVSSGGVLKEWVKYSAYGTPIGLPGGDTDSDGDCDPTDVTQVQTWITGGIYDVRADIDLNGTVDASDKSTINGSYSGITLGRGALSASGVVNRKGYAGYEALGELAGGKWLARNRVFAAELGRWLERDMVSSDHNTGPYEYADGNPVHAVDPKGLLSVHPKPAGRPHAPECGITQDIEMTTTASCNPGSKPTVIQEITETDVVCDCSGHGLSTTLSKCTIDKYSYVELGGRNGQGHFVDTRGGGGPGTIGVMVLFVRDTIYCLADDEYLSIGDDWRDTLRIHGHVATTGHITFDPFASTALGGRSPNDGPAYNTSVLWWDCCNDKVGGYTWALSSAPGSLSILDWQYVGGLLSAPPIGTMNLFDNLGSSSVQGRGSTTNAF